jgi:uncharacterized protein YbjT (DUF2867 family)
MGTTVEAMRCLVTGATGYIGGRLAPRLLRAGHHVRCLTRSASRLSDLPWAGRAEIVEGDLLERPDLATMFDGIDVAYYLVHSLGAKDFEDRDRRAAAAFAAGAARSGVGRIVYLGGPTGGGEQATSAHLRSRSEVAEILASGGVPTVTLRAAIILGSGSASFEMLRYLTERLPVMVTPRWVRNRVQPIAIRDVLYYLIEWASVPAEVNRSFDIGGRDILTFADMMRRYASIAGLPQRTIIPVRVLSPRLSAQWVGLVTPVPGSIARPLVEGLIQEAVCHEHDVAVHVPDPPGGLKGFDEAVSLALKRTRDADIETRWSTGSWQRSSAQPLPTDPEWSGGALYVDRREMEVRASPEALWRVIISIGGETGWHSFPLAWTARGWLDRLIGGVGLQRGRRSPHELHVGEALDFWRVEAIEPGRMLRLRAEMRLPGRAWLEMTVADGPSGCVYRQRAVFLPRGLSGPLYWQSISPFHAIVFGGMARNIARIAERTDPIMAEEGKAALGRRQSAPQRR